MGQLESGLTESVAHVIVVPVSERFIEEIHSPECFRPIECVPGASVIGKERISVGVREANVSHPEVECRDTRQDSVTGIHKEVALHGGEPRIVFEAREHAFQPERLRDHVLVELANNRMAGGVDAQVESRRGTPSPTVEESNFAASKIFTNDRGGPIGAPVIDDQNLQVASFVVLGKNGLDHIRQVAGSVVYGKHHADSTPSRGHDLTRLLL
jgi:hypothetical protein